jgi:hypothetical protein
MKVDFDYDFKPFYDQFPGWETKLLFTVVQRSRPAEVRIRNHET